MYRVACYFFTTLIVSLSAFKYASAEVITIPSQRYYDNYMMFNNSELKPTLDGFTNILGPDFKIITQECGVINAFYNKQDKSITLCYEYLADAEKYIEKAYKKEDIATQAILKSGTFFYVLLHELGHAVIDIRNIPIIGGEEDAADRIATIFLLEITKSNPVVGKSMFVGFLSYAWSKRAGVIGQLFSKTNLYADEHPFNEQRVFNMVCLAYGNNPSLFLDIAKAFKLPPARARRCEGEYEDANRAVRELLK